jgi:YegS/Rv2252/BmrU family lipid kinase
MAGKGQAKLSLFPVLTTFTKAGWLTTVYFTQGKMEAARIAQENAPYYSLVVCSGGDGTLNEVVNGLMCCDDRPQLGYIPAGSANDFAASHKIPAQQVKAAQMIMNGDHYPCDIGGFNDRFFTYIAAFGVFTDVAYETPQEFKNLLGHLAYIIQGMTHLHTITSYRMRIEYEDQAIEDDFVFGMVTNSTSVGGFRGLLPKGSSLNDGKFEVTLIKTPRTTAAWQRLLTALMQQNLTQAEGYSFSASRMRFSAESPVPWTLDGEFGGKLSEVMVENHQKALVILRNPDPENAV